MHEWPCTFSGGGVGGGLASSQKPTTQVPRTSKAGLFLGAQNTGSSNRRSGPIPGGKVASSEMCALVFKNPLDRGTSLIMMSSSLTLHFTQWRVLVRPLRGAQGGRPNPGVQPDSECRNQVGEGITEGTSLTRKRTPLGPYRRPMPRILGGS